MSIIYLTVTIIDYILILIFVIYMTIIITGFGSKDARNTCDHSITVVTISEIFSIKSNVFNTSLNKPKGD